MNRLIYLLVIFSMIGCNSDKNSKTIILKTSGYVEIEPDEASFMIHINCVNRNILQAKNCLVEKSAKLEALLDHFSIQEKDILTTRVDLTKDYSWRNNSYVFNGYKASTTTNVKIRDLKILEELYPELLGNDQLGIGGLVYQHSKMDSLNEAAYLKAMDNANKLADKILSQLPEKNKMITRISNIDISKMGNSNKPEYKVLREENESDISKLPVHIGNMIAEQQLYVEYIIY